MSSAATELHLVVDLVFVRQVVDQSHAHRVLREVRTVIDELPDFRRRAAAPLGHASNELLVHVGVEGPDISRWAGVNECSVKVFDAVL